MTTLKVFLCFNKMISTSHKTFFYIYKLATKKKSFFLLKCLSKSALYFSTKKVQLHNMLPLEIFSAFLVRKISSAQLSLFLEATYGQNSSPKIFRPNRPNIKKTPHAFIHTTKFRHFFIFGALFRISEVDQLRNKNFFGK